MEKAGDVEAKANLQPPFYVRDIDVRCLKGHRPSSKNKEDTYRELQSEASKDKDKDKSHSSSTSANQPQTQASKKDKRGRRGGHRGGHPATGVNATEVAKKDKAPKDLGHIECYTCHQKGHYATKCLDKPKN